MRHRTALLLFTTCSLAMPQTRREAALFADDFTHDSAVDQQLWELNPTSLVGMSASLFRGGALKPVYAEISFTGGGMKLAGVSNVRQFIALVSKQTFTPPYTVEATVMGVKAFANPFALMLVSEDTGAFVHLYGNLNPNNTPAYKIGAFGKDATQQVLVPQPTEGTWYVLTIAVDAGGQATLQVADRSGPIGSPAQISLGTRPARLVISQSQASPREPGPNVALWRSITVTQGASPGSTSLTSTLPPDHAPVIRGAVLPPPQGDSRPRLSPEFLNSKAVTVLPAATAPTPRGQIVATLTGQVTSLNDQLGVFGGGQADYRLATGHNHQGPPVRMVFTWNDTGEAFGNNCQPYGGVSSKSPPATTAAVTLDVGSYTYAFGSLPNLHADMTRYSEGAASPHLSAIHIFLREGGKTIDSAVVPNNGSAADIRLTLEAAHIAAGCDWRESVSVPLKGYWTDVAIGDGSVRHRTTVSVVFTQFDLDGITNPHPGAPGALSEAQKQNPALGVWRNKSTNPFVRAPDIQFTPTEEIDDGQHLPVTYDVRGNTIYVIGKTSGTRQCTITAPDGMTCTALIGTEDLVRVR
jgi:hypothetical protein